MKTCCANKMTILELATMSFRASDVVEVPDVYFSSDSQMSLSLTRCQRHSSTPPS